MLEDPDAYGNKSIKGDLCCFLVCFFPRQFVLSICNKYREDAILKVPLLYLKALKSNGEFLPECSKPRAASNHILARRLSIAEG